MLMACDSSTSFSLAIFPTLWYWWWLSVLCLWYIHFQTRVRGPLLNLSMVAIACLIFCGISRIVSDCLGCTLPEKLRPMIGTRRCAPTVSRLPHGFIICSLLLQVSSSSCLDVFFLKRQTAEKRTLQCFKQDVCQELQREICHFNVYKYMSRVRLHAMAMLFVYTYGNVSLYWETLYFFCRIVLVFWH